MLEINTWLNEDCTLGRLTYGDFKCFTLELPWKFNSSNISCIPEGIYSASKYNSPSKGEVILLDDVHRRTFIEIHAGNYTRQILGCILVGDGIKYLDNDNVPDVTNSKATLIDLLESVPDEFQLKITRG
tara:strand:+ start:35828 stop:36214 length:387 start_codon:yes stop_codon:yes gene_type:complete